MSKKRDEKLFAYEVFMAQATKEGRVRREELSMKVLKPDLSLQARVDHINLDHVRALHEILKNGQPLAPIVVFEIAPGKFKIADGFHRHEVYRKEGLAGIPCIVIKGTLQEAIEYAASANQALSLPRTRADAKKAVFMLLANGWLQKSSLTISQQCGVNRTTVGAYVREYCLSNNVDMPETVEMADGRNIRRKRVTGGRPAVFQKSVVSGGVKTYGASIGGKHLYLGTDRRKAETNLQTILANKEKERVDLTQDRLNDTLRRRGLHSEVSEIHGVGGCRVGHIAVISESTDVAVELWASVAKVLVIAQLLGLKRRVVLRHKLANATGLSIVENRCDCLGVEFMTLDEFVAAVKADEASQSEGRAS